MIDFEHVYKTYETHNDENVALEDINIHIDEGEFVFILGHSGAGKSTFLKLIQMEEKPTEGKVFINGQDLTRIKRRKVPYLRRQMGVVFQDFRLIPTMTVYENVAFAMRVTNISTKKIKDRVPFALSLVGLEDKMDRLPDELSGGEQQRVALARALANNADLIIADEPTGNVDPHMSLEIVDLLMRLNQEGTTVIMVTHEHNLVRMYDKRVILLENGTVAADGRMKNSAHRERTLAKSSSLNRPADGFATKYLDDEEEVPEEKVAAKEPEKIPEKAEEIANETAADDIYRQALESIRKERQKETTGYGSEYDTTYSSVLADYSIYLEDDGEGDESDEK